ncbi:uncharacterized protein LOC118430063 [Branchiostoma floridae]|uniref:Uncharacterized protein LOC118430063 n=1 Tax=Branchiostoma floridae TaxID=7739 RepID=A0A9J7NAE2_BRAFL|nr:uncharacterized protein LOC118430063 [Branchiostoma floridae]
MSVRGILSWARGTATETVTQAVELGRTSLAWSELSENTGPAHDHEDSSSDGEGLSSASSGGNMVSGPYREVSGYGGLIYPYSVMRPARSGDVNNKRRLTSSKIRRKEGTCETSRNKHRPRRRNGQRVLKDGKRVSTREAPVTSDCRQLLLPEFGDLFQESKTRSYTALQLNLGPLLAVWWGVVFGLVEFLQVSVAYPTIALICSGLGQPVKTCFREFFKIGAYVTHRLIWAFLDPWVQYGGQLLAHQQASFLNWDHNVLYRFGSSN